MAMTRTHNPDRGRPAQPGPMAPAPELLAPTRPSPLSAVMQRATDDPRSLTRADAAQLQRTIGNAAVGRLLRKAAPSATSAEVPDKLNALSGGPNENRTGLPDQLKTGIEHLSGLALDDVKVHYNSSKPAQVQALAYTQGTDIHVAPGQEKHLPHEAWHVVQQKQGRVKPTLQMKGVAINDDDALEREADAVGKRLAPGLDQLHRAPEAGAAPATRDGSTIQRKIASGVSEHVVDVDAKGVFKKADRVFSGLGAMITHEITKGVVENPRKEYLAAHLIKAEWGGVDDITKNVVVWDKQFETNYAIWEGVVGGAMQIAAPGSFPVRVNVKYDEQFTKNSFGDEKQLETKSKLENLAPGAVVSLVKQLQQGLEEIPESVEAMATIGKAQRSFKGFPLVNTGTWKLGWEKMKAMDQFKIAPKVVLAESEKQKLMQDPNAKKAQEARSNRKEVDVDFGSMFGTDSD